jgi:hypothetical protein
MVLPYHQLTAADTAQQPQPAVQNRAPPLALALPPRCLATARLTTVWCSQALIWPNLT